MSILDSPRKVRSEEERNLVRQRRVDRLERRWWARKGINLFILWHLFAVAIWLLPDHPSSPSPIIEGSLGAVRPYMTITGFAQNWSMFSPDPDKLDVTLEAEITYANGYKRIWFFPRMSHMSYLKRYREERWRKLVENATHGNNPVLWPPLARYAARVNDFDPQNPPVSVALLEHTRTIPPLGQPMPAYVIVPLGDLGKPSVTAIRPEDLR